MMVYCSFVLLVQLLAYFDDWLLNRKMSMGIKESKVRLCATWNSLN